MKITKNTSIYNKDFPFIARMRPLHPSPMLNAGEASKFIKASQALIDGLDDEVTLERAFKTAADRKSWCNIHSNSLPQGCEWGMSKFGGYV